MGSYVINDEIKPLVLACSPPNIKPWLLSHIGIIISIILLFSLIIIYSLLEKSRRYFQDKCIFMYIISLTMLYTTILITRRNTKFSWIPCQITGNFDI